MTFFTEHFFINQIINNMKKFYGWLGAAALLTLVACTKDIEGSKDLGADGDLYMTMTITQQLSTRTSTPNQGVEIGKDYENAIKSGLLIITDGNNNVITTAEIAGTNLVGTSPNYVASFQMTRSELLTHMGAAESKTYRLFMIANPKTGMKEAAIAKKNTAGPNNVQGVFELTSDATTYWDQTDGFLMTNAELSETTIYASELALGKHTTKEDALNLGHVKIQRAMSRFDFAKGNVVFSTEDQNSTLEDITITFDGIALVNMATKANLFKEVGDNHESYHETEFENTWSFFRAETGNVISGNGATWTTTKHGNYVFSPEQTSWINKMYVTPSEGLNNSRIDFTGASITFDEFDSMDTEDDANYTHPTTTPVAGEPDYYIWRYCMENTNYDKDNQKHGNTTGVVFRAKMTGSKINGKTGTLYAYNNVIYGTLSDLQTYVTNNASEGDVMHSTIKTKYEDAVAQKEAGEDTDNAKLNKALVKNGFTLYAPDGDQNYYCYYIYWNRHNDNMNNSIMGAMEFATVRNNVYKLKVNKITSLGHPGKPGDDPDPDDPGTPDEKDTFWGEVSCEVLPWEVRINNIEF